MLSPKFYTFRDIDSFNVGNIDGLIELGEKPANMDSIRFYFRNSLIDEMLEKKMIVEAGKDENDNQLYQLSNYDTNTSIELSQLFLKAYFELAIDMKKAG